MKDVKILCIDDDEDIRFALGELFAMQNWKSYAASSVAKGLEIFRRAEPDIVLIDYHMPGINGVEGVKLIRTFSPSVPIIVFTIDEEQEIADRFLEAGATDFALKPLKAPDLISRIRLHLRLLEQSRAFRTAPRLDKGLSEETMQVVLDTMREAKEEMTMEAIAKESGLAYQTVHRYLQHLIREKQVEAVSVYGKVGRPKQLFRLKI